MPTDQTYSPGVYRKAGGNILVVGALGRISSAAGSAAQTPTTGSLNANVTSATLTGNDFAGTVSIVSTGTAPVAGQSLFVVTFVTPRTTAPIVIPANLSGGAGSASTFSGAYGVIVTTTGFTVVNLAALTNSSTVVFGYQVIDVE